MMTSSNITKHLAKLICMALAAVFIISGMAKLMNFSGTISYFLEFRRIGPFPVLVFSSLLVSMEITLGAALLAEKNPAKPLLIASGVMAVFTIYQIVMTQFPATFTKTCPCFGASANATGIDWLPVLRNLLLLALSIVCYFYYRPKGLKTTSPIQTTGAATPNCKP